jgi:hypothetical protein
LFGATEALQEQTSGYDPDEYIVHQRNIAALRQQVAPETLAARWAEGRMLDWEQAVELALQAVT